MILSVLLAAVLVACTKTAPVNVNVALLCLSQYGYISSKKVHSGALLDLRTFSDAIADFQNFAGLNVTGKLDRATIDTMTLPRCGVKDKVGTGSDTRSKRYVLTGGSWKVKNLSYRITKYPTNLKHSDVDKEVQRAFDVWSKYTDLTFRPSTSKEDIEIRFESGWHGDNFPFDDQGFILAHAYSPVQGGDVHFDASQPWTIGKEDGKNLFQVATHEFGHSLGLGHSNVSEALMAWSYIGYKPNFSLDKDDIDGIQALYGKKTNRSTSRPPSFPSGESNWSPGGDLCTDSKFDTMFQSAEGSIYIFKGDNYWQLTNDNVMNGYPKSISNGWPGLPSNLDAAFTYKNKKYTYTYTYFFKGKQYWRYNGRKMYEGYPRDISKGFVGIPDDIDAATDWTGNGKIYFFKGSKFWKYSMMQKPHVKGAYPKPIANLQGLPNNIDAAFTDSNGYTYFFKDGSYYRYNDRSFPMGATKPRSTAYWWFGCKEASKGTIGNSAGMDLTSEKRRIYPKIYSTFDAGRNSVKN